MTTQLHEVVHEIRYRRWRNEDDYCRVVGSTVDVDHAMERDACSLLQQHMGQLQTCTYKSRDTHITQHYLIQPRNDRCLYTFR